MLNLSLSLSLLLLSLKLKIARPYPGYAHGNPKRGVCPKGCRPEMDCDITDHEDPEQTLLREAIEYMELYYLEREEEMKGVDGFQTKEDRIRDVCESIKSTGTYEHTFDELQVSYSVMFIMYRIGSGDADLLFSPYHYHILFSTARGTGSMAQRS